MGGKDRETSTHHRFQSSAYVHKPLDSEDLKSNGPETYLSHSSLCRTSIILDSSPPRHPSAGRSLSNSRVKSSCLDLTLPTPSRRRDLSPSARPSMRTLMCSIIDSIHASSHASPCVRQRTVGLMISSTFLHGRRSGFLASSGGDTHRRAAPHKVADSVFNGRHQVFQRGWRNGDLPHSRIVSALAFFIGSAITHRRQAKRAQG